MRRFRLSLVGLAIIGLAALTPTAALAASAASCPSGYTPIGVPIVRNPTGSAIVDQSYTYYDAAGHSQTGTIQCVSRTLPGGPIIVYLKAVLQYLSGLVGLVIVLMIVISGIQYMTAYGDPGRVKSAKDRLANAIIGLFLFIFGFAILSFLIPGGILV